MLETEASESKLGFFQDADGAGHLTDSKSTSGGMHCVFKQETNGSATQQHRC